MFARVLMLVALLGGVALLSACSADQSTVAAMDGKAMAVKCDGCQTKWVTTRTSYGADYAVIHDSKKVTVCKGCDATEKQYLSGKSDNLTCPMCGQRLDTTVDE